MSYISAAVLRVGTDVLELRASVYYLNGVAGAELPDEFSGFARIRSPTDKQHVFEAHLGGRASSRPTRTLFPY
jgi:hypothetical protein